MKRLFISLLFAGASIVGATAQKGQIPHVVPLNTHKNVAKRTEIILPQVNGYNVYKADFHVHTSYSDALVTPSGRVTEAWYDGLDIVAITDHYEGTTGIRRALKIAAPINGGKPFEYKYTRELGKACADFNAIHKEAVMRAKKGGFPMLIVKGCEMGREPKEFGHFNCLFVKDLNNLYDEDLFVALRNVKNQGGIVIHNHPAYRRPKGTTEKTESHKRLYAEGLIDGVECANGLKFYPQMVRRCLEEKLTMFGNTDEHLLTSYRFGVNTCFRTMTLVFAKELTENAVKEALLEDRTLVYVGDNLVGEETLLKDFLNAAVTCKLVKENARPGNRIFVLTNLSSLTYDLRIGKTIYKLEPFKSTTVTLGKNKKTGKYIAPKFVIENMWVADYKHPSIELTLDK